MVFEEERSAEGGVARVATVFLTGRECPWRCVMCDLWQHTTLDDTPAGATAAQVAAARHAIDRSPDPVSVVKLYNAGSFFDPRAVPDGDYAAVARSVAGLARVIVESHPALVGTRTRRFLDALGQHATGPGPPPRLEVAMGLETAHPDALDRLHKRMNVDGFRRAAGHGSPISAPISACFCWCRRPSSRASSRTTGCCARSTPHWRAAPPRFHSSRPGRGTAR